MTRLPPVTEQDLDAGRREVWDLVVATRGGTVAADNALLGSDGALVGPFNAMVTAPAIGLHQARLGAELRFNLSFDRRLGEVAICTVGAHWKSEFEFWVHSRIAIEHGVSPHVVQALAAGTAPAFDRDDEAGVYAITRCLLEDGRVDDNLFERGVALLGHQGIVELVGLIGYYCTISLTLNVFEVALPNGQPAVWLDGPDGP